LLFSVSAGGIGAIGSGCWQFSRRWLYEHPHIRHLYLDIDHDSPAALAKIQQSNLVPLPNYTVNTSPDKFQVVWRVENVSPEQAECCSGQWRESSEATGQLPTRLACFACRAF
jgi:hypothetical protein